MASGAAHSKPRVAAPPAPPEIAIVGMGCRLPGGADGHGRFWHNLLVGHDAIRPVPPDRWDVDAFYSPARFTPGRTTAREGGLIDDVATFDAEFFGISAREALAMDPQHRLMLEVAWQALEDANVLPRDLDGSDTGVFIGSSTLDYYYRFIQDDPTCLNGDSGYGNTPGMVAGRISNFFGLRGPSLVLDTTCSSAMTSLHLACNSLLAGECSLALVGGVNVIASVKPAILAANAGLLSESGRCRVFDAGSDGFVRGEGAAIVVLKPLSAALRDGDRIHATILSTALNHNGASFGPTSPSGQAQQDVIAAALRRAGVSASDIGYVEAHGAATALADPIEMNALSRALAGRNPSQGLWVGAVKSSIGNLEAAGSLAGLIKAVLAISHAAIPPTLHVESPNPKIRWGDIGLRPATSLTPWPEQPRRIAGVSAFGFSGTNGHAIIAAAPSVGPEPSPPAGSERLCLALSARSPTAVAALAARHREAVELHLAGGGAARDYCETVCERRSRFAWRAVVLADGVRELLDGLTALARGETACGVWRSDTAAPPSPRIAVRFPDDDRAPVALSAAMAGARPEFALALRQACDRAGQDGEAVWRAASGLTPVPAGLAPALNLAIGWALMKTWRHWGVIPGFAVVGGERQSLAHAAMDLDDLEATMRNLTAEPVRRGLSRPPHPAAVRAPAAVGRDLAAAEAWGCSLLMDFGENDATDTSVSDLPTLSLTRPPEGGAFDFDAELARAFVAGLPVIWARRRGARPLRPVTAATYSFERRRFWHDFDESAGPASTQVDDSELRDLALAVTGAGPHELPACLNAYFDAQLRRLLGADMADAADSDLAALGVDSLMLMRLQAALEADLGLAAPLELLGAPRARLLEELANRVLIARLAAVGAQGELLLL